MSDSKVKLVFATNNQHKLEEVKSILGDSFQLMSMQDIGFNDDVEETESTFEGNAYLKAKAIFDQFKLPCFSDDSGLEVEILNNAPGVYSARYAGEHGNHDKNMDKLLTELLLKENRNARFRTVICYIDGKGLTSYFNGIITGQIANERHGEKGFGYDPIFKPDGFNITFAEMDAAEKNIISHRAIAVKELFNYLQQQ